MSQSSAHPPPVVARNSRRGESGQAFIELAFIVITLVVMLFALIDFGRAIYRRQVIVNLSREGANLAARGTGSTQAEVFSNAVAAMLVSANPLNLSVAGSGVIVTGVTNNGSGRFYISRQLAGGGVTTAASKIGNGTGRAASLPGVPATIPPSGQTLYAAEVFAGFQPITPIGKLLAVTMARTNYDVAYFVNK
jgi:Flp pilus assembly protein TadG